MIATPIAALTAASARRQRRPGRARRRPAPALAAAASVLLLLAGCEKSPPAADQAEPGAGVVQTMKVHARQMTDELDIPARVAPDPATVVHIYSQISGRLSTLLVRPGQEVSRGQTIATLESSDIAQARSDYEKARIEAVRADAQLKRAKDLLDHQVLAEKDYEDALAAAQAAHAEQARAEQRIRMLGFSPAGSSDTTTVRSPIRGVVLDIGSATGEMQRSLDNASAIATVADLDHVWVLGDVYERDQARIRVGMPVTLSFQAYPGESVSGRIVNISDSLDPTSLTLKARVVLPNPGHRYKPLMYASMAVLSAPRQVFLVPQSAVIHNGSTSFVFVPAPGGKFEKRTVTTGRSHQDNIEILTGLGDGDTIVTAGAALLRDQGGQ